MSNPLLFIPSPRDIPEVRESVSKLKIDKLWVKYYPQELAYKTGRQWFLEHKEYTHFVIHPDDLIVTQYALETLMLSAEDRVISGWCQNTMRDTWEQDNQSSISYILPFNPPRQATYESFELVPIPNIEQLLRQGQYIIPVKFSGFALQSIPRSVIEEVPFISDHDCCMDSTFSLDLDGHMIKQFCNLRVRTKHLRRKPEEIQTGKREERIIFESV